VNSTNLLTTSLIGFIVGIVGIGLGGLLVILFRRPKGAILSAMLGLAGGIMLSIICFELIPESISRGTKLFMYSGFVLGIALLSIMDRVVSHLHMSERDSGMDIHEKKLKKMGLLLTIGISLHVFPESLAIGAGFAASAEFGLMIALLMAFQNIPEGVALATPNHASGSPRMQTMKYAVMAGAPMGLGSFLGYLIGGLSPMFLGVALGFAGGAMFYVTCDELIPTCHTECKEYGHIPILSIVVGFVIGLFLTGLDN
jgi:zinc transporter, ZIP family